MQVEPVNRVLHVHIKAEHDLSDNNIDRIFYRYLLYFPNIIFFHLKVDNTISKILTEADMDDIACQNVIELLGHINLKRLIA